MTFACSVGTILTMSPLKVTMALGLLATLDMSPSREGIGTKVELVKIGRGETLQFKNDLDLSMNVFAGCVSILNREDKTIRFVNLDRGDKTIITREGSPWAYVVRGVDWGRRR